MWNCPLQVRQYYFVRHDLVLRHPYLPCLIQYGGHVHVRVPTPTRDCDGRGRRVATGEQHASFYPLELLAVYLPPPPKLRRQPLAHQLFREIDPKACHSLKRH
jgi:hypothetical protein